MTAPRDCRPPDGTVGRSAGNVIPLEDGPMRRFIDELAKVSPYSRTAVRRRVHECWREAHRSIAEPPHD